MPIDLLRYLTRRVGRASAEDIVSEVFITLLRGKMPPDCDANGQRAWLFGVATNLLRRYRRDQVRALRAAERLAGQRSAGEAAAADDDIAERLDAHSHVHRLATALVELEAQDLDVLLLIAWAGFTPTEVGLALSIPAGTVRSRLHRIRCHLRAAVEATTSRSKL